MCIYLKAASPCKLCHEAKKKCTISGISVAESVKKRQGVKKGEEIVSVPDRKQLSSSADSSSFECQPDR